MKIYTVIVTYNAMQWIDRCLQCLRDSSITTIPVIIDNLSTDGTRDYIPSHYPEVVLLPQDRNLGFGQGNNVGIRYALEHEADYVLLLNQDAYIHSDSLQLMLEQSDGKSLLSPVHLNGDGSKLDKMFRFLIKETDNRIIDDILVGGSLAKSYIVGRISAACWFLPAAVIRRIGGFNPLFFHYSEDDNYLCRLKYHGINTVLVPLAKVNHDRGEHGNVAVFNAKKLHRDILLIACDINRTFPTRIKAYLRRLYECYAWELPVRSYIPFAWSREILWLLLNKSRINYSRKQEMREGQVWL